MTLKSEIEKYMSDILGGKIVAGELTKLAIQRQIDDLRTGIDRGLYFDEKAAKKVIDFYSFVKLIKGAEFSGQPFNLQSWQKFILWCAFGWKKADGKRRFTKVYNEVARKNGKSTFVAPIGLYLLCADKEPGAEVYTAATTKDQAKIVWDEARNMVKKSPSLNNLITVYKKTMFIEETASKMEPLSSDADSLDGLNPHGSIIDEYHAHKTSEVYDVIVSGMGSRTQPLNYVITTAGFNLSGPCFLENKLCQDILRGIKVQDNYFSQIFALDLADLEHEGWREETNWYKANPNLGISKKIEYMRNEYKEAINNETKVVPFKTKHLNIWCASSIQFIGDEKWCNQPRRRELSDLYGQKAWAGLDLSASTDITALVAIIPRPDGIHDVFAHFWIPEAKAEEMQDRVDYKTWSSKGYVTITSGEVIDIEQESSEMIGILHRFDLQELAIDPARAYHGVTQNLEKEGFTLTQFRQGFISMDAPTKEVQRLALSKCLAHNENPVLRWMNSNVEVSMDSAGNIKLDKKKARQRIDGMIALVMAEGAFMSNGQGSSMNSFYENNDVRTL